MIKSNKYNNVYLLTTETPLVKYIDNIVIIWYFYMATIAHMLWLAVFL